MASTLRSKSVIYQPDFKDELNIRSACIRECHRILKHLDIGIYNIAWEGIIPGSKNLAKNNLAEKVEIRIENIIEYGKFIYLRKPYVIKKVRIDGKDISTMKTWKTQQIIQLVQKLKNMTS